MADDRRIVFDDEDRLPWLEAVDQDAPAGDPGIGKLIAAVLVCLLAIGLIVGGIFWLRDRGGSEGSGDLIAAPSTSYKVRPDEPGGMKVEGEGDTAFAASDGRETNASIDLSALPETPVAGAGSVTASDAALPASRTVATATPAPQPPVSKGPAVKARAPEEASDLIAKTPATGGGQIQLGAFSTEAKANAAWKTLSSRFSFLAPLEKSVMPVASGDKTLYRLRAAAGGRASSLCARLKVAGETCAVVG